jgi:hypothetical protein
MVDNVNHPQHYMWLNGVEVIDIVEPLADESGWNVACAVKYLLRCDHKGSAIEDMEKAVWYITREIQRRKSQGGSTRKSNRRADSKPLAK